MKTIRQIPEDFVDSRSLQLGMKYFRSCIILYHNKSEVDSPYIFFINFKIFLKILQGDNILFSLNSHGIRHKYNTVNTPENQATGGIVLGLPGNRIDLYFNIITVNLADFKGNKIEKKGPVSMGFDADQFSFDTITIIPVDTLQTGGLAPPVRAVVDNLGDDFLGFQVNDCHCFLSIR